MSTSLGNKFHAEEERFRELLLRKKLKYTLERKQILDEVMQLRGHFDADGFYALLKKKKLPISRDTVYRTLPLLLECGVVQKSVGDGRRDHFERLGTKGHHDHMVCIGCGSIIEFTSPAIEEAQSKVCEAHGFRLVFHDHRLFGHCKKCQKD